MRIVAISRYRRICAMVAMVTALLVFAAGGGAGTDILPKNGEQPAKHIILFIGDGMQLAHEVAASRYLFGRDDRLVFHSFPYRANVTTWDVTTYNYWARRNQLPDFQRGAFHPWLGYDIAAGGIQPYPIQTGGMDMLYLTAAAGDSASGATAWATGRKTDSGNIAWRFGDPPGGAETIITEILRDKLGFAIGVVSTVPFSHATPAAHVSHNVDRDNFIGIANEIIHAFQPDVVIGGGHPRWVGAFEYLSDADYNSLKTDGAGGVYEFVERQTGVDGGDALLAAAQRTVSKRKKLFGLFGGRDSNFESPQPQNRPDIPQVVRATNENPLLNECVAAALSLLSTETRGFFVMFEQGDIDWANHANDFRRMIGTVWDLDLAVRAAVAFVDQPGDALDWSNTLLIVTADHANGYMRFGRRLGRGELPHQVYAVGLPCQTAYCGAYLYPGQEIRYGSSGHTNELVRLYAIGSGIHLFEKYEGAWYPGTRILDNTHLFRVIAEAVGLDDSVHGQDDAYVSRAQEADNPSE